MARFSLIARPFFRRHPSKQSQTPSTAATSTADTIDYTRSPSLSSLLRRPRKSSSVAGLHEKPASQGTDIPEPLVEQRESVLFVPTQDKAGQVSTDDFPTPASAPRRSGSETLASKRYSGQLSLDKSGTPSAFAETPGSDGEVREPPQVVLQEATPARESFPKLESESFPEDLAVQPGAYDSTTHSGNASGSVSPRHVSEDLRPRQQSILGSANADVVTTEVELPAKRDTLNLDTADLRKSAVLDYFTPGLPDMSKMLTRKIWVRRPGASATLVQIKEEDLVDDVRDMILRKYANSLGRTFDSPDMLLRIVARAEPGVQRPERVLGPEEDMCRTIDLHFPGGQTVEDALVIDVPHAKRTTPRPSPRVAYQQHPSYQMMDEHRPVESGTDYFPPMPAIIQPTMPQTTSSHDGRITQVPEHQRSISVLSNGHLPALPSPGGTRTRHLREHRPKYARQHTSSPTIVQHGHAPNAGAVAVPTSSNLAPQPQLAHRGSQRPRVDSSASERPHLAPSTVVPPAPLPTPPVPEAAPTKQTSTPPTPSGLRVDRGVRPRKGRKLTPEQVAIRSRRDQNASDSPHPGPISNMLDASIPPINVLIVEDNIINLRILEGLMKRLRVRWETAMNGQIAVDKWRKGGYHLVLMDIQMPIMNGLQATKEIRRLEKVNGIGVFSSSAPNSPLEQRSNGKAAITNGDGEEQAQEPKRKSSSDQLPRAEGTFKSPVIIVALTASSLQSDRHEALAAGCNDFLTKPVNFVWLERKVKEWGCMQALIDFDGWRRWKDFAAKEEAGKTDEERRKEAEQEEKQKKKMEKLAILQERQKAKKEADEARKRNRTSVDGAAGGQPSIKEEEPQVVRKMEPPAVVTEGGERDVEEQPAEAPVKDDV